MPVQCTAVHASLFYLPTTNHNWATSVLESCNMHSLLISSSSRAIQDNVSKTGISSAFQIKMPHRSDMKTWEMHWLCLRQTNYCLKQQNYKIEHSKSQFMQSLESFALRNSMLAVFFLTLSQRGYAKVVNKRNCIYKSLYHF